MQSKFNLLCSGFALAWLSALGLQPSTLLAQGSLTPPGAPAPTMKSLDQIEARTAITNASDLVTILQPGSYYLTHNLIVSMGDAIDIATNNVMLNLNGFAISSTAAHAQGSGILIGSGLRNVAIVNGFIQSGVTNNGSGVYSGTGFGSGIECSSNSPVNVLVSHVSVSGCLYNGVNLNNGESTVVESCTATTVGSCGICASTIKQSWVDDCGDDAIHGVEVSDCHGGSSGSGDGVYANTADNCEGLSNSGNGIEASTVQNCLGISSSGTGISASTAQTCYAGSNSGYGVFASTAQNCYGWSSGGYGVGATIAVNCYGEGGLLAFIANSCSGTSLDVTHNLNSY